MYVFLPGGSEFENLRLIMIQGAVLISHKLDLLEGHTLYKGFNLNQSDTSPNIL